jgi:hypothetical protein
VSKGLLLNDKILRDNGSVFLEIPKILTLSVSSGLVASDLSNFPLLVHISTQSGIENLNTTEVFDEVGSNFNRLQILDENGTSLPIEVESWDTDNKEGYLWTNVPAICSTVDTELKLRYDSNLPVNPNVFSSGNAGASAVWNSDFKSVWHLGDTNGTVVDSTSANTNGIQTNDATSVSGGVIDRSFSFDGVDDYISVDANISNIEGANQGTISLWFKSASIGHLYSMSLAATNTEYVFLYVGNSTTFWGDESISFLVRRGLVGKLFLSIREGHNAYLDDQWRHLVLSIGNGDNSAYINGVKKTISYAAGNSTTNEFSDINNPDTLRIAGSKVSGTDRAGIGGNIDEFRILGRGILEHEAVAEYNSQNDTLVVYS